MTICECAECVAARKWIVEKIGVGGGPRPLSFLIASHEYMATERKKYEVSLKKHIELVNRLMKERKELERVAQLLREAAVVSDGRFVCPPAFEPAVRAAMRAEVPRGT